MFIAQSLLSSLPPNRCGASGTSISWRIFLAAGSHWAAHLSHPVRFGLGYFMVNGGPDMIVFVPCRGGDWRLMLYGDGVWDNDRENGGYETFLSGWWFMGYKLYIQLTNNNVYLWHWTTALLTNGSTKAMAQFVNPRGFLEDGGAGGWASRVVRLFAGNGWNGWVAGGCWDYHENNYPYGSSRTFSGSTWGMI